MCLPTQAATTTRRAADIYDHRARARARGASHQHAARILGRAWCQIIWRLWHDHDTYEPTRPPHRTTTPHRRDRLTVPTRSSGPTSPRHPATARRRRHRRLPAGQSAQRLTASRPTLPQPRQLTQRV
jgi:hypothetical protein